MARGVWHPDKIVKQKKRIAERQNRVFDLISKGYSADQIARKMKIPKSTLLSDSRILRKGLSKKTEKKLEKLIRKGSRKFPSEETKKVLEKRRKEVMNLTLQGWTAEKIGHILHVNKTKVNNDLNYLRKTVDKKTAQLLNKKPQASPKEIKRRRKKVLELRKLKLPMKDIGNRLGVSWQTISQDLLALKLTSPDAKWHIEQVKVGRNPEYQDKYFYNRLKKIPLLSPEKEKFRKEQIQPLMDKMITRYKYLYNVGPDMYEIAKSDGQIQSYILASKLNPGRKSGITKFIQKTANGIVLNALRRDFTQRTGLSYKEISNIFTIIRELNRDRTLEQISREQRIPLVEVIELLDVYKRAKPKSYDQLYSEHGRGTWGSQFF